MTATFRKEGGEMPPDTSRLRSFFCTDMDHPRETKTLPCAGDVLVIERMNAQWIWISLFRGEQEVYVCRIRGSEVYRRIDFKVNFPDDGLSDLHVRMLVDCIETLVEMMTGLELVPEMEGPPKWRYVFRGP
jgi:hypothetical protein